MNNENTIITYYKCLKCNSTFKKECPNCKVCETMIKCPKCGFALKKLENDPRKNEN